MSDKAVSTPFTISENEPVVAGETKFQGPVFVVGLPRSGTSLLRDLLNRNPKISMPRHESEFIPYMIDKFGCKVDLTNKRNLKKFYSELINTAFYYNMQKRSFNITIEDLELIRNKKSWTSIFEFILRFFAEEHNSEEFVYGDKSPGYVNHLKLLNNIFPDVRFIHIIRDPRDHVLSMHKAWRRNLFRAAARWTETIEKSRNSIGFLNDRYIEVYYEELLDNPEKALKRLCDFLDCDFCTQMLSLENPAEKLGDARDQTVIVRDNKN
ncbi:MAG: sulfotransferase family protein, partial [Planctomycetota bacterium]